MAITLYHVKWCPECALVRAKLAQLKVAYDEVIVPDARPLRTEVYEVSGQYYVPVLKDGETVLTETRQILAYLEERYGGEGAGLKASGEEEFPSCSL